MNKKGEIIVVDDDADDSELFCDLCKELAIPNAVKCFNTVQDTLIYLRKVESDPFFILSDLRMPVINGFELKQMIHADANLLKKAIPIVLYSTSIDSDTFNTALLLGVQGFFVKPNSYADLRSRIEIIVQYMNLAMGNLPASTTIALSHKTREEQE